MHIASIVAPFALLAVTATANPIPVPEEALVARDPGSTLTFTVCKYTKDTFSQECGAIVTYDTPSGHQEINLGVSRELCTRAKKQNASNSAGFSIAKAGIWDRNFMGAVMVSYKGRDFRATYPKKSIMMDWSKMDSICSTAFPGQDKSKLQIGEIRRTRWSSTRGSRYNAYGSFQEIFPNVPDLLKKSAWEEIHGV